MLLKAQNIKKQFDDNIVLKDISLTVEEGEVISIIGPSGSGKSTLLRCLTQLEKVDSGYIEVCGKCMVETKDDKAMYSSHRVLHQIILDTGLVFQNFNLFPHYSVLKNIVDAQIKVLGKDKQDAQKTAMALLEKMNLGTRAKAYPGELSGGQQQRGCHCKSFGSKSSHTIL